MPFCTRCGSSIEGTERFCSNCGSVTSAAVVTVQPGWNGVQARMPPMVPVVPAAYVVLRPPKSVGAAILLTILFGPLGMLYSTVPGALIMIVISVFLAAITVGLSLFITWPICIIWGALAAQSYNEGRS
jgi:hypothetical protein